MPRSKYCTVKKIDLYFQVVVLSTQLHELTSVFVSCNVYCLLTDGFFLHCLNRLSAPPETLDQLGNSLALLEQLQQDLSNIEAKFPPLHQQFAILEKYEVAIPEEVKRQ